MFKCSQMNWHCIIAVMHHSRSSHHVIPDNITIGSRKKSSVIYPVIVLPLLYFRSTMSILWDMHHSNYRNVQTICLYLSVAIDVQACFCYPPPSEFLTFTWAWVYVKPGFPLLLFLYYFAWFQHTEWLLSVRKSVLFVFIFQRLQMHQSINIAMI